MSTLPHHSCAAATRCGSFKHHVGKALNALVRSSPGHVPTTADIPKIISQAWPVSITAVNLMSGLRKTGYIPSMRDVSKIENWLHQGVLWIVLPKLSGIVFTLQALQTQLKHMLPPSAGYSASGGPVTSSSPDSSLSSLTHRGFTVYQAQIEVQHPSTQGSI